MRVCVCVCVCGKKQCHSGRREHNRRSAMSNLDQQIGCVNKLEKGLECNTLPRSLFPHLLWLTPVVLGWLKVKVALESRTSPKQITCSWPPAPSVESKDPCWPMLRSLTRSFRTAESTRKKMLAVQSWFAVFLSPWLTWCKLPWLRRAGCAALELALVHACVMAVIRERDTVPHWCRPVGILLWPGMAQPGGLALTFLICIGLNVWDNVCRKSTQTDDEWMSQREGREWCFFLFQTSAMSKTSRGIR